jgi:hypothetical protein
LVAVGLFLVVQSEFVEGSAEGDWILFDPVTLVLGKLLDRGLD